ncbi:Thioredoxin-like [Pedobacter sp. ok626]|uniref:DUF5106 domain-containing protein n=1 Tax=Pedobacter sp. ok626 TaxID=1761882 RepID=UPI000888A452|nr:DUF5106 domain-containing protein [Pedobacter sp. ok626]SDK56385.1 Thioredoxin-like [Pedobacter sp. ok626]
MAYKYFRHSIATIGLIIVSIVCFAQLVKEKQQYVMDHYWDNYDFRAGVNNPLETERALLTYLEKSRINSLEKTKKNLIILSRKMAQNCLTFNYFHELFRKFLYDPNSPMRSEHLYRPLLTEFLSSPCAEKKRLAKAIEDLKWINKNNPGMPAPDFLYTMSNGKNSTLYSPKSPLLLLILYNPECESCIENQKSLINAKIIRDLLQSRKLKILSVYIDFKIEIWKKQKHNLPKTWLSAYDPKHYLRTKKLYDLRSVPTMYLLNRKKNIILKDANFDQVIYYLTTSSY